MTDMHAWVLNMGPYTADISNESVGTLAEAVFAESADYDDPEAQAVDREARAAIHLMAHAPQLRDALDGLLDAYYVAVGPHGALEEHAAVTAARTALKAALY